MTDVAKLAELPLPVVTLKEALPHLRRPFTPDAVRWKVQSTWGQNAGAVVVAYIDARLVVERLNRVCAGQWFAAYREAAKPSLLWCDLTLFQTTRSDVGESVKGASKDIVSDALKRAAVHFGVGVSIYAMKHARISMPDKRLRQAGKSLVITDEGHKWLRDVYGKWLERTGIPKFGEPLDHGDEYDVGLEDPDEAPVALADERAVELRGQIDAVYAEIRRLSPRSLPPAAHEKNVRDAESSHEQLEAYALRLGEILTRLKPQEEGKAA